MGVKLGVLAGHDSLFEVVRYLLRPQHDALLEGVGGHLFAVRGIDPGGGGGREGSQQVDLGNVQGLSDNPPRQGTHEAAGHHRSEPQLEKPKQLPTVRRIFLLFLGRWLLL